MPWLVSLSVHAAIVLVTMFASLAAIKVHIQREMTVPNVAIGANAADFTSRVDLNKPELESLSVEVLEKVQPETIDAPTIANSSASPAGPASGVILEPAGEGPRPGEPVSKFFGLAGTARHVVYVIDASGSMIVSFDDVRREVLSSISRLGDSQDFHIILFAEGKAIENPPRRLVKPTRANKIQTARFLSGATFIGSSNPLPALRRAFEELDKADTAGSVIYLLTDGEFHDNFAVVEELHKLNAKSRVSINTFLYGQADQAAVWVMRRIATEHNGLFRQVDQQRTSD